MRRTWRAVGTGFTVALSFAASATAGAQGTPPSDRWTFTLTPAFWMAGMNGTLAGPSTPTVDVSAGWSDIIHNIDLGINAAFGMRRGPYSVNLDGSYIQLSRSSLFPNSTEFTGGSVVTKTAFYNGTLGYRVTPRENLPVDLLAGARVWDVHYDLELSHPGQPNARSKSGDTWVDPVVGARIQPSFNESVYGTLLADVGGFGVGSDLTWQLYGGAGWRFSDLLTFTFGYRIIAADFENDQGFVFDMKEQGLLLGFAFSF